MFSKKKGYIFRGVPFFSLLPVYGSIWRKILTGFPCQVEVPYMIYSFQISLRPRFYMEKNCPRKKGSPSYLSYLGRAKFSFIFLQNLTNHLHERQKVGSARRVTRLRWQGPVPAELTFLHINTLACPAGSTRSRRDGKSMRGQLLIRAKGSNSFSYKRSLKLTRQGR